MIGKTKALNFSSLFVLILFSLIINSFLFSNSFISFIFCWIFKGSVDQSLMIHESWQDLKDILPSLGLLNKSEPSGAIAAIGWGTAQVYTSSLLKQFNLFIFFDLFTI